MDTLKYIIDKYEIDTTKPSPHYLNIGRFKDVPRLFRELGFKKGAEVGVFQGEYSKWLLRMIPGLRLYGVDLWEPYKGYKDFRDTTIRSAYDKTLENTKGYDFIPMKGWSHEIVNRFEDESLDFVFIDGNHQFEWVVRDIADWSKKVRPGGIIYGHDYDDYSESRRWNEMSVIPAVDGWMNAHKINPWFVIARNRNKSWMYVKSQS